MKSNLTILLLTVCGGLAFSAGCGNNTAPAPPTAQATPAPADTAGAQSQKLPEAQKPAEAPKTDDAAKAAEALQAQAAADKPAVDKAAAEKLAQAAAVAAQEQGRIQGLFETAKNLTGQNKYAEALKVIGELSTLKLTPEQQALLDGLKTAAEKQAAQAVSDKAAARASKAIGDALGGKK